jgi:demethylmenaquinone methyltransferase / 2-methoxy-6-polyprenyl-1,4-benzoquinol methylase
MPSVERARMKKTVGRIFSSISERYDLLNHVMSLGIDIAWRRRAAREIIRDTGGLRVLDVATGTGDLTFAIEDEARRRGGAVTLSAVDSNREMLALAITKSERARADIKFEQGDAVALGYPDRSFDVVACAFGLRNFEDLPGFVRETRRVLRPGGRFVFLDLAMPDGALGRSFFKVYSRFMVLVGSLVDRQAYEWLVGSISGFDRHDLARMMEEKGFRNVEVRSLFPGIAFIATGELS